MDYNFRRGTTPLLSFDINSDLTGADVWLTISQGTKKIVEKSSDDELIVTPTKITISLSQQETLNFRAGTAEAQIKYIFPNGMTDASDIALLKVGKALKEEVVEWTP